MHGRPMITGRPSPKAKPSALIDAGDEFDRELNCSCVEITRRRLHNDALRMPQRTH
jgi:hypothetical protein